MLFTGAPSGYGALRDFLSGLGAGATLCLNELRAEGARMLFAQLREGRVTSLRCTASLFRMLARLPGAAEALAELRLFRFGGEPPQGADVALAQAVLPAGCTIINAYGSTESLNFYWTVPPAGLMPGRPVPAGRIEPGGDFTLLDEAGAPCAAGEAGELVIRSRYNATGEWRDGACHPGRFQPDPLDATRTLYRTGDLARLLPEGDLLLLGRLDRMVKINGQRVGLLEVEAALQAMPELRQAAVLPRKSALGTDLLGFVVLAEGEDALALPALLRHRLRAMLPAAMVPARIMVVKALPMLPSGKLDAAALLAMQGAGRADG